MTDTTADPTFGLKYDVGQGWHFPDGWRPAPEFVRAAYEVLDQIDADPRSWIQDVYWCGSGGCFAGWRTVLSGERPVSRDGSSAFFSLASGLPIGKRAAQLLGFPSEMALDDYTDLRREQEGNDKWSPAYEGPEYLFSGTNTRQDLGELVMLIFGPRPDDMP